VKTGANLGADSLMRPGGRRGCIEGGPRGGDGGPRSSTESGNIVVDRRRGSLSHEAACSVVVDKPLSLGTEEEHAPS
jgi:hypothetical protein